MKLSALYRTLRFLLEHPLNRNQKRKAVMRFIRWQIGSRLVPGSVAVPFVEGSRLLVNPGMRGATGNVYAGLQDFEDMAFVLHSLRRGDRFLDVGANVGSYTVLASAVVGAECLAIEPVPTTFRFLCDNVNLNGVHELVQCLNIGVSSRTGVQQFTTALGAENRVALGQGVDADTVSVPVRSLDEIAEEFRPSLIKIDVEGYETEVISGAGRILRQETLFAVLMELGGAGERYGFDEMAVHRRMIELGFNPCLYYPFQRRFGVLEGMSTSSGNILYARDTDLITERVQTAPRFCVSGQQV